MADLDAIVAGDEVERLKRLLRSPAKPGGRQESVGTLPDPLENMDRLEAALARARDGGRRESGDLAQDIVRGAATGLAKARDGAAALTLRELVGLEAVILTNGTRPSLTVRDGFVDLDGQDVGDWRPALDHFAPAIRSVIAAVGRVDRGDAHVGTAFAIAPDLVVTARHVLEAIATRADDGWRFGAPLATVVFPADASGKQRRARVIEVAFTGDLDIEGRLNLDRLDMAVLRLGVDDAFAMPAPVRIESSADDLFDRRDIYVVGFPARPRTYYGADAPPAGYEANSILMEVFNFEFGVKKLAPGQVDRLPGQIAGDIHNWAFSHDASTLQGNSGSCVVDLTHDGARVVGLHFAGISREQNYAHSLAALREQLSQFPVAFI